MKTKICVIGLGSVGSACIYYLSREKHVEVYGIDQYSPPHKQGSHSGNSRIYRKSYFEHEGYVPLLEKAYKNWEELERVSGKTLRYHSGLLYQGKPDSEIIKGIKLSSTKHNIPLLPVNKSDYPYFNFLLGEETWLEPNAGYVLPEKSIETYLELAKNNGTNIINSVKIKDIKNIHGQYSIFDKEGNKILSADRIIIAAGGHLKSLNIPQPPLRITKQQIFWYRFKHHNSAPLGNFPCWMFANLNNEGCFYGFPPTVTDFSNGEIILKTALHYPAEEFTDPNQVQLQEITGEHKAIEEFRDEISKYFPNFTLEPFHTQECIYTNAENDHFNIDFVPDTNQNILLATGFSGHGFKFITALGELISKMSIDTQKPDLLKFLDDLP